MATPRSERCDRSAPSTKIRRGETCAEEVQNGESDCDDVDVLRVGCEGFEIFDVCRNHGSSGFGRSDHERIDCGTTPGEPAEKRSTSGKGLGDSRRDVASLEKLVLDGVSPGVPPQTLDENDGWDMGRPQSGVAQGEDQRQRLLRTFGKARDATGVQDQHSG